MKKVKVRNTNKEYTVGKILCVGQNYLDHAKEMGGEVPRVPMIFMKPTSTLIYNGDSIVHPNYSDEMHHEVELVLLIGKEIKNANIEEAELIVKEIKVDSGSMLKRLRPAPQGRAHRIRKRSNHVTIVVGANNNTQS